MSKRVDFSWQLKGASILLAGFCLILAASADHNFKGYSVPYGETWTFLGYEFADQGLNKIRLCGYNGSESDLKQNLVECDIQFGPETIDYTAQCSSVVNTTCYPWVLNDFNLQLGRRGGSCIKKTGDCLPVGISKDYFKCGNCFCLQEDCGSGQEFCNCSKLGQQEFSYTFDEPNKLQPIFCANRDLGNGWEWSGGRVEYACFLVNVSYYVVDNDEDNPPEVDATRDESWNLYAGDLDTVCNQFDPINTGDFGDRCWGSRWQTPSAGFCAKKFDGTYPDGACWDGYCAFAIDDQTNTSGPNAHIIWDENTQAYSSLNQVGNITLGDILFNDPLEAVGHYCAGYFLTPPIEVATFCVDQDSDGWEKTRAETSCNDNIDDDGDGWVDEPFRFTNEMTCVECNESHHTKDNTSNYTLSTKELVCEVGCFSDPGCDEVPPNTENATGAFCDEYCMVSLPCPNSTIPSAGEACYNPGIYNWGSCASCTPPTDCGPNTCYADIGDHWCDVKGVAGTKCHCVARANLTMDIGNDNEDPWEWENNSVGFENTIAWELFRPDLEAVVVAKINDILTSGCESPKCSGCVLEDDDCLIPIAFRTSRPNETIGEEHIINGTFTISDIDFSFYYQHLISDVGYSRSFDSSDGSLWDFDFEPSGSTPSPMKIPQSYEGTEEFSYTYGTAPNTRDAMDEAMYRLLAGLDSDENSEIDMFPALDDKYTPYDTAFSFDPDNMWFDGKGVVKTASFVGPIEVKLVVWT